MYIVDSADGRPKMPIDSVPMRPAGGAMPVTGPLTDAQLRSIPVPVIPFSTIGAQLLFAVDDAYSDVTYCGGARVVGATVGPDWVEAPITAQIKLGLPGEDWMDVYDDAGNELVFQVAPGRFSTWPAKAFTGYQVRFRSGTAGAEVPQTAGSFVAFTLLG